MVLRGAQIQPFSQARCSLFSTQSLLHDLARLYGRALPLTSPALGAVADLYIDELWTWQILMSHGLRSLPAIRAKCCESPLPRNQLPMQKGHSIYPVIAMIALTLFTWIVAIWASCSDSEEHLEVKKLEKSSDEHDHRKAA